MTKLQPTRLKALTVTAGLSLWFFIITTLTGFFSIPVFVVFVAVLAITTQILARKLANALEVFAAINTKIFLGILFVFVMSLYGIFFRVLRIDLLRMRDRDQPTYWLLMESDKDDPQNLKRQF